METVQCVLQRVFETIVKQCVLRHIRDLAWSVLITRAKEQKIEVLKIFGRKLMRIPKIELFLEQLEFRHYC